MYTVTTGLSSCRVYWTVKHGTNDPGDLEGGRQRRERKLAEKRDPKNGVVDPKTGLREAGGCAFEINLTNVAAGLEENSDGDAQQWKNPTQRVRP